MPKDNMGFGLSSAIPDSAKAGWGARMIFPNDLLGDRQGFFADDEITGKALLAWLNGDVGSGSPLWKARANALQMSNRYEITPRSREQVTLYEDAVGIIVGNPQGSHGYLYVAAWLKG